MDRGAEGQIPVRFSVDFPFGGVWRRAGSSKAYRFSVLRFVLRVREVLCHTDSANLCSVSCAGSPNRYGCPSWQTAPSGTCLESRAESVWQMILGAELGRYAVATT